MSCTLTRDEDLLAQVGIRENWNNDSRYFRLGNQYDSGSVDDILKLLPSLPGAMPNLRTMGTQAFLCLLMYNDRFPTFNNAWAHFCAMNSNQVPAISTKVLIIGLYSTTGMKTLNEAGFGREHIAENHAGHFGLLILNIRRSECTIYDSMNHQFDNSPYFLSTKIKNAVTGLHDFYRRGQGKEKRQLAFSQAVVPGQGLNDCGVHLLANAELAAQGHEPAV